MQQYYLENGTYHMSSHIDLNFISTKLIQIEISVQGQEGMSAKSKT